MLAYKVNITLLFSHSIAMLNDNMYGRLFSEPVTMHIGHRSRLARLVVAENLGKERDVSPRLWVT